MYKIQEMRWLALIKDDSLNRLQVLFLLVSNPVLGWLINGLKCNSVSYEDFLYTMDKQLQWKGTVKSRKVNGSTFYSCHVWLSMAFTASRTCDARVAEICMKFRCQFLWPSHPVPLTYLNVSKSLQRNHILFNDSRLTYRVLYQKFHFII